MKKEIQYRYSNESFFDDDTDILITEPINAGEYELKLYLRALGIFVEDVSNNKDYWKKDIDLLIHNDDESVVSIEVKWDSRIADTGNLFIETITNEDTWQEGWFAYCKADFLFYGDSENKVFYVISLDDLRAVVNAKNYKTGRAKDWNGKPSIGLLVPLTDIKDVSFMFKLKE